jgi:hypothetical protein
MINMSVVGWIDRPGRHRERGDQQPSRAAIAVRAIIKVAGQRIEENVIIAIRGNAAGV